MAFAASVFRRVSGRVTEFIDLHPGNESSLERMAGLVGLSPHHFAYAFKQSVGLQNLLDLAKYTNRLSLGVTIGLRAAGLGLLADDRRHLAANIISRGVARDLHSLGDRERRIGNWISYHIGACGAGIQSKRAGEERSERQYRSKPHLLLRPENGDCS